MFKIEIPIEVKEKTSRALSTTSSGASNALGGSGDKVANSLGKMAGAVALGTVAATALSALMEGLMKNLEPLTNVLKSLFVVIFLPLMPLITELSTAIGDLIKSLVDTKKERGLLRDEMTFGVLQIKDADSTIARLLKSSGAALVDFSIILGDAVQGALGLWLDLWKGIGDKLAPISKAVTDTIKIIWEEYIKNAFIILGGFIISVWTDILKPAFSLLSNLGEMILNFIMESLKFVSNLGEMIWDSIKNGLSFISNLGERIWDWIKSALRSIGGLFGGARANGGTVSTGKTFLVGERGPELFTPSSNGNITPNNKLTGGGITINVSGNSFNNESDMRKLVSMISTKLQQQGRRSIR